MLLQPDDRRPSHARLLSQALDGAILRVAKLSREVFEARAFAQRELFEFIEMWYNRQRRHSSLGYRSPAQLEDEIAKVS